MVRNLIFILIAFFLLQTCSKEVIIYNSEIDGDFELGLILKLNDKNCLFDSETNTLKYSLSKANLNNFSPTVAFHEYSNITFNGLQLVNNTTNNFGNIELHKVYTLNITVSDEMKTFKLIFTDIPLIQLITRDKIQNEPKILGKMILNHPEINQKDESWIKIEIRGASSAGRNKTSFGFNTVQDKTNNTVIQKQFFDMNSNDKWILDALYIDKSKVRNRTSHELWKQMKSTNFGIKSKFVEVYINNKAIGLYSFNENYSDHFLSLNSNSVLYSGIDNSQSTQFEEVSSDPTNSSIWGDWEQKFPNPSVNIKWTDFKSLNELIVNGTDSEFTTYINAKIELDNLIDYFLFVNMCNGYDNVGKNYFFMKKYDFAKFEILIWDLDATWGRDSEGGAKRSDIVISNGLFHRLISLNPDNFKNRLKSRWNDLRSSTFSNSNLTGLFNDNITELINYKSIDNENYIWNTTVNLLSEKNFINNNIANKLTFLDNYISNL